MRMYANSAINHFIFLNDILNTIKTLITDQNNADFRGDLYNIKSQKNINDDQIVNII